MGKTSRMLIVAHSWLKREEHKYHNSARPVNSSIMDTIVYEMSTAQCAQSYIVNLREKIFTAASQKVSILDRNAPSPATGFL